VEGAEPDGLAEKEGGLTAALSTRNPAAADRATPMRRQ
jgi:hypothetical protein